MDTDLAPLPWRDAVIPGARPLAVRLHGQRPRGATLPLVLHLHGGAYIGGSLDSAAPLAQLIAGAGAIVASLDYPLAPAHPFPQAIEAAHAAAQWLARQRTTLAGARAPLFVAGEEAGANLAAAVALMARDSHQPELAGQILLAPMLDACVASESMRAVDAGCVHGCKWAEGWRRYLGRACDVTHPYATPLTSVRLAGLPPTLLLTARDDPMRDDARRYAERLREAGVPTDEQVLAAPTGWPDSLAQTPAAQATWPGALQQHLRRFLGAAARPPLSPQ